MGDMADDFRAYSEHMKWKRQKRNKLYEPKLIELGAIKLSDGVYRLGDWDFYPYKGICRNFKTNKRNSINKQLNRRTYE